MGSGEGRAGGLDPSSSFATKRARVINEPAINSADVSIDPWPTLHSGGSRVHATHQLRA